MGGTVLHKIDVLRTTSSASNGNVGGGHKRFTLRLPTALPNSLAADKLLLTLNINKKGGTKLLIIEGTMEFIYPNSQEAPFAGFSLIKTTEFVVK